MHSHPFFRLVWKDARSQFALWCALLIGAFVLQALVMSTAGGARNSTAAVEVVGAIAFVLTACFIVACIGMSFAGETEEGTREWLQQLPVRPWTLVSAKLSLAVVSTALFLAVTWISGLFLAGLAGHSLEDMLKADISQYQKSLAGAFAWGLLFSLLLRRVMHVLLAAVVAEIFTVAVTDSILGPFLSERLGNVPANDVMRLKVYLAVTALVLCADLFLAYRWARVGVQPVAAETRRRFKPLSVPGGERRAQAWLNRVVWAARRGSPEGRANAVLVWREARTLVPFAGLWIMLGLVMTDFPVVGQALHSPFPVLFLIATPAVCGLMTCLGDQRQQMYRFLGERGVSPARVWGVKQAVWLLAAIVLTLLFFRWDAGAAERLRDRQPANVSAFMIIIRSLHVPGAPPSPGAAYDRAEDTALQLRFLWALGCSLFAAGQCASFWLRRSVLAFGLMLIATPVLVGWHYVLATLDVPFWLGSWPLTFALLAATLSSASAWLRGRDSWRLRLTRLAAVALPVGAVALGAAVHRAFSVPAPVFPSSVAAEIQARQLAIDTPNAEWSTPWSAVLRDFPPSPNTQVPLQYSAYATETRERLLALSRTLASGQYRHLDPLVLSPDRPVSVQAIATFLTEPTYFGLEAQRSTVVAPTIAEQWQGYEAGLRIASYLAEQSQSFEQWFDCVRARSIVLAAIRQWAQGPDQTPESLATAAEFLAQDYVQGAQSYHDMVVNRHVFYTDLLNRRGRKWEQLAKSDRFDSDTSIAAAWLPWFERERGLRVLGQVTNEVLSGRNSIMHAFALQGDKLRRWAYTTSALPTNLTGEIYTQDMSGQFLPSSSDGEVLRNSIRYDATRSIVALQQYRLAHGALPASLAAAGSVEWGGVGPLLAYEPQGLPADLQFSDGRVIPAGQPLLLTAGHAHARLQRTVFISPRADGGGPVDVYRIAGRVYDDSKYQLASPPLQPTKVMFVDLSTHEADLPPMLPESLLPEAGGGANGTLQ